MAHWTTTVLLLTSAATVLADNNGTIKSFVIKLEDYVRVNAEQAQAITECRNEMETLNRTVEKQKGEIDHLKLDFQALNKSDGECTYETSDCSNCQ